MGMRIVFPHLMRCQVIQFLEFAKHGYLSIEVIQIIGSEAQRTMKIFVGSRLENRIFWTPFAKWC